MIELYWRQSQRFPGAAERQDAVLHQIHNQAKAAEIVSALVRARETYGGFVAAEWAVHCRPEMSRNGADAAVHPVRWREDAAGRAHPTGRAALALQRLSPPVHRPLGQ